MQYGTEEQKKRFIPKILTCEEIWATGYSEPSSGSDMAAARTSAVRDGDDYVVNGQKIWTTLAHISDWYFVLVRTSTEGPKWAGLTLLLMDLKSPGVTIKPIKQIDGGSEFNEVFMTDVRVPVTNRLGDEGQGWEVVSSALVNERSGHRRQHPLRSGARLGHHHGAEPGQDAPIRTCARSIADLAIKGSIMRCAGMRSMTDALNKRINPHLSAAMKLMGTLAGAGVLGDRRRAARAVRCADERRATRRSTAAGRSSTSATAR